MRKPSKILLAGFLVFLLILAVTAYKGTRETYTKIMGEQAEIYRELLRNNTPSTGACMILDTALKTDKLLLNNTSYGYSPPCTIVSTTETSRYLKIVVLHRGASAQDYIVSTVYIVKPSAFKNTTTATEARLVATYVLQNKTTTYITLGNKTIVPGKAYVLLVAPYPISNNSIHYLLQGRTVGARLPKDVCEELRALLHEAKSILSK